jgi:hypothetical protein
MPVETPSLFANVIQDHLELKRKNAELDNQMPLERYRIEDPFENHPLFKTEEQARIEETMDGDVMVPVEAHTLVPDVSEDTVEDGLWGRSRDFDWGDYPLAARPTGARRTPRGSRSPRRRRSRSARSYGPRTASSRCAPGPSGGRFGPLLAASLTRFNPSRRWARRITFASDKSG